MLFLVIPLVFFLFVLLFMRQPAFGAKATGLRLARMTGSGHYQQQRFENLHHTPALTEGASYGAVMWEFAFNKSKRGKPKTAIPTRKTNLHELNREEDLVVWMGHSSYYLQIAGKRLLVDPVFSGSASPVSFTTKAFKGADVYTIADIPPLDYLLITHDHWDHLDHTTVTALEKRTGKVITGLGTGAHLEHWGYPTEKIIEMNWEEAQQLTDDLKIVALPARHFSGRSFKRNVNLWVSFALLSSRSKIYVGGDSGYDTHFANIGAKYGPFDLVILECGQYDKSWKYIHMHPSEVLQAATDLRATALLPVHWAKFQLGNHAWDESINTLLSHHQQHHVPVSTPMIGEVLKVNAPAKLNRWWDDVE